MRVEAEQLPRPSRAARRPVESATAAAQGHPDVDGPGRRPGPRWHADVRRHPGADPVGQPGPGVGLVDDDRDAPAGGEVGGQRDVAAEADDDVGAGLVEHTASGPGRAGQPGGHGEQARGGPARQRHPGARAAAGSRGRRSYPVLTFWHKGHIAWGDYLLVEVSTDGGSTWTGLQYTTEWISSTWRSVQLDLRDYRTGNVVVRFVLTSDGTETVADGWYVDDVRIEEKDPQRLPFPFTDNFESGSANWTVSGHDWNLTTTTARSATHSLTDSPAGNYLPNSWCAATLAHPIDLSAAVDPVLTFWHKGHIAWGDYSLVEVSTDGGSTWTGLQYTTEWISSTWHSVQLDLRDYRTDNVMVRFALMSDGTETVADGWYIDDVRIEEKDPQRLPFPFTDTFENGSANWTVSGQDWSLTTAAARSATHSLTDSPAGNYLPNSWCAATLAHPIDLGAAVDPVLTFWHKGHAAWGDYLQVQVSSDGGTTWTGLQYTTEWTASTWHAVQLDLRDYRTGNVVVRFALSSDGSATVADGWYVDDVRIEEKDPQRLPFPFTDNFESGSANWTVSGHDWNLTTTTARSATHSLTDSPAGNYLPNSWCAATLAHPIDLSAAVDPVLTFWHKGHIAWGDYSLVEVSTDGGSTWTGLQYTTEWISSTWQSVQPGSARLSYRQRCGAVCADVRRHRDGGRWLVRR